MKEIQLLLLVLTMTAFVATKAVSQNSASLATVGLRDLTAVDEATVITPTMVNVRAARDFIKRFNDQQARWYMVNDTSHAKFSIDDVTTTVGYAKNGRWLYTIKNFGEKKLPEHLRDAVRSQYYDYRINIIYELLFPVSDHKVYIIYLGDDARRHKVLRIYQDNIEVVKNFKS